MPRKFAKKLPCRLGDTDVLSKNLELMQLLAEEDRLKEVNKGEQKAFKEERKEAEKRARDLREQCRTRIEHRDVVCTETRNDVLKTMEIVRIDDKKHWPEAGSELVSSRVLTPSEMQIELIADHQRDRDSEGPDDEDDADDDDADDDDEGDEDEEEAAAVPKTVEDDAFEGIPEAAAPPKRKRSSPKAAGAKGRKSA